MESERAGTGERYAKQILVGGVGAEGQSRISASKVVVIGLGALGSVIASQLCRAGVGYLRLVDRDFVELSNLQRQVLFDEEDARRRLPKVIASAEKLQGVNREVEIEPIIADLSPRTVEELVAGCDLVLDGTDNWETRFLLNDACVKAGIPWIYGGAVGTCGCTLTVIPNEGPCLRCFMREPLGPGVGETCDTAGVLAAVTGAVASLQCAAALKLLATGKADDSLVYVDVWERQFSRATIRRRDDCPTCQAREFEFLEGKRTSWTTVLCGRNSVQIMPALDKPIAMQELERRLAQVGRASYNGFLLSLAVDGRELVIFPNGRTIVRGTTDEAEARSLYARYVGM